MDLAKASIRCRFMSAALSRWGQSIIDVVAAIQAEQGDLAAQSDVRVRLLPPPASLEARRSFDAELEAMIPAYLERGGLPATPMLRLTPRGWLQSSVRPSIDRLIKVFLDTYRALSNEATLHKRIITWPDLVAAGIPPDSRGLLGTAGGQLHLFAGGTTPSPRSPADGLGLELPWDIDELLHMATAEEFTAYRTANPIERINFFQRLRLRVTGEIQRIVDAIYETSMADLPFRRKVDVKLRRNGDVLENAVRAGFVVIVDSDRVDERVALTYHGLWLARAASDERAVVVAVLRALAKAYVADPMRERLESRALVESDVLEEVDLRQVRMLFGGWDPPIIVPDLRPDRLEFFLAPWLMEVRDVQQFDDVVYALGQHAEAAPFEQSEDDDDDEHSDEGEPTSLASLTSVPELRLPRLEVSYGNKLGSGAFGTVWQARDTLLEREVAVKFLTSTDEFLNEAALLREARSLAKVSHPNLVTVYTAAWLRHPETGLVVPAILMELLQGTELSKWSSIQHEREQVLRVASGMVDGLQAMHAAGLHHGDLHTENVLVLADATTKIIDWRYQDSFLAQSTAQRRDLVEVDQRRVIDLILPLFDKQGLKDLSLRVRHAPNLSAVREIIEAQLSDAAETPADDPVRLAERDGHGGGAP